jgi:hypothetical protein
VANDDYNVRLTSAELANLWTQYMNDSMSICFFSHCLKTCKDQDVYPIIEHAIGLSKSHITSIEGFFKEENYPIPKGFSEEDVNLQAPALFSDILLLIYLHIMSLHGLNGYALSLGTSSRADQRKYFIQCNTETMELFDRVVNVMLNKGIFSRAPFINAPHEVDFVTKQSFLTGWLGDRRQLNSIEISGIHYNMQKIVLKVILELGFSQVTTSKELREYFQRGAALCEKHLEIFDSILTEDHLSSPKRWEAEVTNSTDSPYSDKLMLFHVVTLLSVAVGYYGAAMSVAQRRDLMVHYTRLTGEMGKYAEDGVNILIKNGWMEQPPTADDREGLAKLNKKQKR